MAFRRKTADEVGWFDEDIQYGFDEVEFSERVCKAGYKMVLDPNVFVWHKHRSTLREFLKQNFQYGRGSGVLLKKGRMKDAVSTWSFLSLMGFMTWLLIVGSLSFLTFTSNWIVFPLLLFGFTVVPILVPMIVYAHRAIENRRYARAITYPFIDFLRVFSFCLGEIFELFKKSEQIM